MKQQEELIKKLLEMPNQLYDSENLLLKKKKSIDEMKNTLANIEARVKYQVLEDSQKEEMKSALSNMEKREVEKNARLKDNSEFQKLAEDLRMIEEEYHVESQLLKRDERIFQSVKAVAYLIASR